MVAIKDEVVPVVALANGKTLGVASMLVTYTSSVLFICQERASQTLLSLTTKLKILIIFIYPNNFIIKIN